MKDLNALSPSFEGQWLAVLDFLSGIPVERIEKVNIAREKGQTWKVDLHNSKDERTKKTNTLAGLYDLSW